MKINEKRLLDLIGSGLGILLLMPLFFIIALIIKLDSKGSVFFRQPRVGKNMLDFNLLKFRTMYSHTSTASLLTIGYRDARITRVGRWLRKYKIDELPQLYNVLRGQMSLVGPRPEVRKYVNMYTEKQRYVLSVKPGITDWASVDFFNENELLSHAEDPESYYIKKIIPEKIKRNMRYITNNNISTDIKIIWLTFNRIIIS